MKSACSSIRKAILVGLILAAADAHAVLISVCDGVGCDHATVQDAIDAASADDTILINKFIHTESNIVVSKNLTIAGIGQHATVVQASPIAPPEDPEDFPGRGSPVDIFPGRVFDVPRNVEAVFRDLTIRHGFASYADEGGGGIRNSGLITLTAVTVERNAAYGAGGGIENGKRASLTINAGSIIRHNAISGDGGGVSNDKGTVRFETGVALIANVASGGGGGVSNSKGSLELDNATIEANRAAPNGGTGGGIQNLQGAVTVTGGNLTGNHAYSGGAIYSRKGQLEVLQATISQNEADNGGGMQISAGEAFIIDTGIDNNLGRQDGGGIATVDHANVVIHATTISRNLSPGAQNGQISSSMSGVGLFNSTVSAAEVAIETGVVNKLDATLTVINSTIAKHAFGIRNFGVAQISNSIVANNSNRNCDNDVGMVQPQTIGPNLSSDDSCQGFDFQNAIAGLEALGPNGGPTHTHALLPISQAIDTGDDNICAQTPILLLDQRGEDRPQGAHCDLGAYETEGDGQDPGGQDDPVLEPDFAGPGSVTVQSVLGSCFWDGQQQQLEPGCNGPVSPGPTTIQVTPVRGSSAEVAPCDELHFVGPSIFCTRHLVLGDIWLPQIDAQVVDMPKITIESHYDSSGEGFVEYFDPDDPDPDADPVFHCGIEPAGATVPDPCTFDVYQGEVVLLQAVAFPGSFIFDWTEGCDEGTEFISPDGSHGECTLLFGADDRTVKIRIDGAMPADDQPEVVAATGTPDFPEPELPRFDMPRMNGDRLVYRFQFGDPTGESFGQRATYQRPWSEDPGPWAFEETGGFSTAGGETTQIVDVRNWGEDENFTRAIEEMPDGSLENPWKRWRHDGANWYDDDVARDGDVVNPTISSIDKVALHNPWFVFQAAFEGEGDGMGTADLSTSPVDLNLLFLAEDLVGDGFAFDAFHPGAVPGIALNPPGDGAVVADIVETATGSVVDGVLTFRADTPGASLLLREGQETEFPGVFISRLTNVAMDGGGVIVVLGRIAGAGITSLNDEAIWACIAALCSIVVQEGMEPAGMPGVRLRFPGSPVVHNGVLLMRTGLEGTGIDATNNNGVLLVDLATGVITLAAQKGDALAGNTIADFTSKAFSNAVPLVVVRLGNFVKVLARIDAGGLVPLISPGDEFELPDGTVGTVAGVIDIPETGGEDGRASATGGGGYAIVVNFDDGRQGIVICTAACLEGG